MKGTERRRELLSWLEEQGSLSLNEIVERFGVSKMTAHRDLEVLEGRQALKRIHGGAICVERGSRSGLVETGMTPNRQSGCLICQRPIGAHLLYSLTLVNGEQRQFCCPHCGVSAQLAFPEQVAMALATDFLAGRPHPAQKSWFVLGSVVSPCCQPSVLTFEDETMARRFVTGFGGTLGHLPDALEFLQSEMLLRPGDDGCPHCAPATRSGRKG